MGAAATGRQAIDAVYAVFLSAGKQILPVMRPGSARVVERVVGQWDRRVRRGAGGDQLTASVRGGAGKNDPGSIRRPMRSWAEIL